VTSRPLTAVRAVKVRPSRHTELPEDLATEEPLEIRLAGPGEEAEAVAVTMRTPGHDFELAAGFTVTEGLAVAADIAAVGYCDAVADDEDARFNVVTVALTAPTLTAGAAASGRRSRREFVASASCGVCGKASIDEVDLAFAPVPPGAPVAGSLIPQLPDRLRQAQKVFAKTGGLHAAGLFSANRDAVCVREDVGRHNAVDKVVGHLILGPGLRRDTAAGHVLMVSGRVSFEIVQKAAAADIGVIAAVSAPTSLAVRAADRLGIAIAGFVRGGTYNLYSRPERIDLDR
jgi:FdhD protein